MENEIDEESEILNREQRIFAEYPVPKAVATMVIPTIISQIITVIYNLSDTWYVGLTGNAAAVAAISLCLPVYNIMTAFGNLFGIGGASVIARAMGTGKPKEAQTAFSLAIRGAFVAAVSYAALLLIFARPFLLCIGGDASSIDYAVWYTIITMVIGGIPTILSAVFPHLIRSTGESKTASFGITIGAVLNMVLDPLFMFVILPKGNEVIGAAIATAISNIAALTYFIRYVLKDRENPIFRLALEKHINLRKPMTNILKCGVPSFFLLAAGQISNFFLNGMIAEMGASAAVAGIGVVRKIDSLAYAVNQGITQGMLPIVAYCYASHRIPRMKSVVAFSSVCTVSFSFICSICSYLFAPQLIGFFINDADTIYYGTLFLRILCIAVAIYPLLFVIISVFQAVGQSVKPFLLSLLHKGSLDIVLFFVIRKMFGLEYILWASPIMAAFALTVAIILILRLFRSLHLQTQSK
ncbi:MAG: MATE family efflux transporter [Lachnospiraceae bacterium]|nr:MATE family efflux transporter [Lachnospiraceae bacterium]